MRDLETRRTDTLSVVDEPGQRRVEMRTAVDGKTLTPTEVNVAPKQRPLGVPYVRGGTETGELPSEREVVKRETVNQPADVTFGRDLGKGSLTTTTARPLQPAAPAKKEEGRLSLFRRFIPKRAVQTEEAPQ
jgi:hypothetical protein